MFDNLRAGWKALSSASEIAESISGKLRSVETRIASAEAELPQKTAEIFNIISSAAEHTKALFSSLESQTQASIAACELRIKELSGQIPELLDHISQRRDDLVAHIADAKQSALGDLQGQLDGCVSQIQPIKAQLSEISKQRLELEAAIASSKQSVDRIKVGQQMCFLSQPPDNSWVVLGIEGNDVVWKSGTAEISSLRERLGLVSSQTDSLKRQLRQCSADFNSWSSEYAHRRKKEIEDLLASLP